MEQKPKLKIIKQNFVHIFLSSLHFNTINFFKVLHIPFNFGPHTKSQLYTRCFLLLSEIYVLTWNLRGDHWRDFPNQRCFSHMFISSDHRKNAFPFRKWKAESKRKFYHKQPYTLRSWQKCALRWGKSRRYNRISVCMYNANRTRDIHNVRIRGSEFEKKRERKKRE